MTLKKLALLIVKTCITIAIFWIIVHKIDLNELFKSIKTGNVFYLSVALIFFVLSKLISSFRLNHFLKVAGIHISEKLNRKLYWLGMYYNLFLPGGVGGDGYKIYLLQKHFNSSPRKIFSAILLDRITGMLALFILLVILSYCLPYPLILHYTVWLLIPASILICYLLIRWMFPDFTTVFKQTNMTSFGVQISQLIEMFFILLALHHTDNITAYLFVFLISSVVAVIPFTIGGVGSRELTFLYGAQWLHLNINTSVAISLTFFLITAIVSLWGIAYSFNDLKFNKL
jgi:uncharacterized membrane protein YbhN (UPF0104 family)